MICEMNPCNIEISFKKLGSDYVFLITGGDAHIGASVTAYIHEGEIQAEGVCLPHHKEYDLAKELAILATHQLGVTVTVTMGIHVDQATKEMIKSIVSYVKDQMNVQLEIIRSGGM